MSKYVWIEQYLYSTCFFENYFIWFFNASFTRKSANIILGYKMYYFGFGSIRYSALLFYKKNNWFGECLSGLQMIIFGAATPSADLIYRFFIDGFQVIKPQEFFLRMGASLWRIFHFIGAGKGTRVVGSGSGGHSNGPDPARSLWPQSLALHVAAVVADIACPRRRMRIRIQTHIVFYGSFFLGSYISIFWSADAIIFFAMCCFNFVWWLPDLLNLFGTSSLSLFWSPLRDPCVTFSEAPQFICWMSSFSRFPPESRLLFEKISLFWVCVVPFRFRLSAVAPLPSIARRRFGGRHTVPPGNAPWQSGFYFTAHVIFLWKYANLRCFRNLLRFFRLGQKSQSLLTVGLTCYFPGFAYFRCWKQLFLRRKNFQFIKIMYFAVMQFSREAWCHCIWGFPGRQRRCHKMDGKQGRDFFFLWFLTTLTWLFWTYVFFFEEAANDCG